MSTPQDPFAPPPEEPGAGGTPPPEQPGWGAPPPGYGAPPPSQGGPPPGYGAPPPGYGGQPGGPPPGYGAPPPGYGAAPPGYGGPPGAGGPPPPGQGAPLPPYGGQPGYPQPYGYGGYAAYPKRGTNVLAILALVFAFVCSPVGIVLGAIGLNQVKRTGEEGRGIAIAGLVLSVVFTLLAVLFFVAVAVDCANNPENC